MSTRWTFVVNPGAGGKGSPLEAVRQAAIDAGIDGSFHETRDASHLRSIVADAITGGERDFVAVGGDGTVNLVVDEILTAGAGIGRCRIAVVSAGSGGDLVRTFGRAGEGVADGVALLANHDRYPIDVGRIEGSFGVRHFVNAANLGVAAASADLAARLPRWIGQLKYTVAFWLTLWRFPRGGIDMTAGRHRFTGEVFNLVIANGQFFGGGLNVAPRASMADGVFDVQVFRGPRRNAFVIMPRLLFGSHLTHRAVQRYVADRVEITAPEQWPVEADGELLGHGGVTITVLPGAIDMVV